MGSNVRAEGVRVQGDSAEACGADEFVKWHSAGMPSAHQPEIPSIRRRRFYVDAVHMDGSEHICKSTLLLQTRTSKPEVRFW
jgi:hypothetical protein